MRKTFILLLALLPLTLSARTAPEVKPRIVVSTDIGGTDPDDNQSMFHLLMFSDRVDIEGLISSPSYGEGSKEEILRMIDVYAQDYTKLTAKAPDLVAPDSLRNLCKQGQHGTQPLRGYSNPTEGSDWIIRQAKKEDSRPLWILVWGGLDDLAQALHDAPEIAPKLRVYWIGGPNKKWSVNSYNYIAKNFPNLWMIENNAAFRGFIAEQSIKEIKMSGAIGETFNKYYGGSIKMGDTPSLLYMMDGNPEDPARSNWGGQFTSAHQSDRFVFNRLTSVRDTITPYSILEIHLRGPRGILSADTLCMSMNIRGQWWDGYYLGNGEYLLRFCPKEPGVYTFKVRSPLLSMDGLAGIFVVYDPNAPGNHPISYKFNKPYQLGDNWHMDMTDQEMYEGKWAGAKTIRNHRNEVLQDWQKRF